MDPNDYYPNHNSTNNWAENPNDPPTPEPQMPTSNGMAIASLTLGIASIILLCCGGGGFPAGALGIVFALLSRRNRKMHTQAKVGLGLSIGGITLSILSVILSFVIVFASGTFTDMINMMNRHDLTTQSGLEDFLEDWEDYIYEGTYSDDLFPDGSSNLSTDDFI